MIMDQSTSSSSSKNASHPAMEVPTRTGTTTACLRSRSSTKGPLWPIYEEPVIPSSPIQRTPLGQEKDEYLPANNDAIHTPALKKECSPQNKDRVSPTSILGFPSVNDEGVEVLETEDGHIPWYHGAQDKSLDGALSNLQQPAFVDNDVEQKIRVSITASPADSSPDITVTDTCSSETEDESAEEDSEHITRHTIIRCEPPLEKLTVTKDVEVLLPKSDDGGDQEATGSSKADPFLPFESFDPFDVSDGSAEEEEKLFANNVENNIRWTYISNIDGTASAHPTYTSASVSVKDMDLLTTKSKTAPKQRKRRVSFDEMMQVRYFCRTQEEMLDMKKFSVMLRRHIRRRRRRTKLNLSDSSEEDLQKELGWTVATKVVARDDDSLSGILADVVDEISDMISEVVIDAKRAHDRHQEEQAFFRDLEHSEEADIDAKANAARTLQGFLESVNTTAASEREKHPQSTPAEELSTAQAMAQNFFQTLKSTTPLDGTANGVEDEDDEPWFCKAMRCGGKCGEA